MIAISRKVAAAQGLNRYYTGIVCPNGHITERYVLEGRCIGCVREHRRRPDVRAKARQQAARRWANPEYRLYWNQVQREYRKARRVDPVRGLKMRLYEYAYTALRLARKKDRSPTWADNDKIKRVYELCKMITEDTGTPHHVDHCVPLCGKQISGLHVHQNLQIIPATENWAKGNKWLT